MADVQQAIDYVRFCQRKGRITEQEAAVAIMRLLAAAAKD